MSDKNTNATQPEVMEAAPLVITGVNCEPEKPDKGHLGTGSVSFNNGATLNNVRFRESKDGKQYCSFPQYKDAHDQWRDILDLNQPGLKQEITAEMIASYAANLEQMRDVVAALPAQAAQQKDRPSLTGALKDKAEAVKAQPVKDAGKQEQVV